MAGMSGSSILETEARTSGKGESSFSVVEPRSYSILDSDGESTTETGFKGMVTVRFYEDRDIPY
jgi:hypothetical protein